MKRNVGFFSLIVMLFISSLTLAQEMSNEAKMAYNEGNKFLKAGDYENAVKQYQEALKSAQDYRIYYQLGITLKKQGKIGDAETAFENSIKANKDFAIGYNGLGGAYFVDGKYAEAVAAFKKFDELTKKSTTKEQAKDNIALALVKLAEITKKDGNPNKAIEYLTEAISYSPNDAAYVLLATTYFEAGDYDKTLDISEKALNLKSFKLKGAAYYYKGMAYKQKQDQAKAKENFMLAQKDPQYKKLADYELKLMK